MTNMSGCMRSVVVVVVVVVVDGGGCGDSIGGHTFRGKELPANV